MEFIFIWESQLPVKSVRSKKCVQKVYVSGRKINFVPI